VKIEKDEKTTLLSLEIHREFIAACFNGW